MPTSDTFTTEPALTSTLAPGSAGIVKPQKAFSRPKWLSTHPALSSLDKVVLVGDIGDGHSALDGLVDAVMQENCSQLRLLGDLVYPRGIKSVDDPHLKERFLKPLKPIFDAGIRTNLILGNHDYRENPAAWLALADQYPSLIFPNYYYAECWGNVLFTHLCTTQFDKIYRLKQRYQQLLWLKSVNRYFQHHRRFKLALGHHPLRSSGPHGNGVPQLQLALRNNVAGKVQAYFSGHEHITSREGEHKGTHYYVAGSGTRCGQSFYEEGKPTNNKPLTGYITLEQPSAHKLICTGKLMTANGGIETIWKDELLLPV